jgi:hypothetical protein
MGFYKLVNSLLIENSLGLIEDIDIQGIGKLKAKTDTGNDAHNVLHGIDVKIEDDSVNFTSESGQRVQFPLKELIKIHIGSGNIENRPVVLCNCSINGKKYFNVPFSISDRSQNDYKVLLGAPFIKVNGGVVDVTKKD